MIASFRIRPARRWLWLLAAAMLCPNAVGCRGKPPDAGVGAAQENVAEEQSAATTCANLLNNALTMLDPENLGISTDRAQVVDLLNQWMPRCGNASMPPSPGPVAIKLLESQIGDEQLAQLVESRFNGRDVDHIRTCTLMKRIVDSSLESTENDRERVNRLFDWVVRNVALADDSARLPITTYEVVLFGRGTAEDRAWVFAELLRQLRIDSVIVRPRPASSDGNASTPSPWLVGVLLDESDKPVLLFDARLGFAVPASDDPGGPLVERPATLNEAVSDPAALQRLAVDESHPYRLTAEALKSVAVEAIVDSDYCRPRQETVQNAMTAGASLVIYDPLDDAEGASGLIARIGRFGDGKWSADDVTVWAYPERQVRSREQPVEAEAERLLVRRHPFEAPAIITVDKEKQQVRTTGTKKLQWRTRIAQLQGDWDGAVKSYQIIRIDGQPFHDPTAPPDLRWMHLRAEEDAFLWTGVCQAAVGDDAAAVENFNDHLARYPGGEWTGHARRLQALSYATSKKLAAAVQTLNGVVEADVDHDGSKVLQNRLRAAREKLDP